MPNFEDHPHSELYAAVANADPDRLRFLADQLALLGPRLLELGETTATQMSNVEWQSNTADSFRVWGTRFRSESGTLSKYVTAMSESMRNVEQALREAKATMPEPAPVAMVGTDLPEVTRLEAVGVMERLASHYQVAAEHLHKVSEPEFEVMQVDLEGVQSIEPARPGPIPPYGASGGGTAGSGTAVPGTAGVGPAGGDGFVGAASRPGQSPAPDGWPQEVRPAGQVPPTTEGSQGAFIPPTGDGRTGTSLDSLGGDSGTGLIPPSPSAGDRGPLPAGGRNLVPGDPYVPFGPPGAGGVQVPGGRFGPQTPGGPVAFPPRDHSTGQAARNPPPPRMAGDPGTGSGAPVGRPMAPGYGSGVGNGGVGAGRPAVPPARNGIVGGIPRPSERLSKGLPRGGALTSGTVAAMRDPGSGAVRGPGGGLVGRPPVVGTSGGRRAEGNRDSRASRPVAGAETAPDRQVPRDGERAGGVTGRPRPAKRRRRRKPGQGETGQRERDSPA